MPRTVSSPTGAGESVQEQPETSLGKLFAGGTVAVSMLKSRDRPLDPSGDRAEWNTEPTGTKSRCFTEPQKWCSGPTRIFNKTNRVGRRYFRPHRDQFESTLPRWWVLKGLFECEPLQNNTIENGAPVPPGETKVHATAEHPFQSTQRRLLAPRSFEIPP